MIIIFCLKTEDTLDKLFSIVARIILKLKIIIVNENVEVCNLGMDELLVKYILH